VYTDGAGAQNSIPTNLLQAHRRSCSAGLRCTTSQVRWQGDPPGAKLWRQQVGLTDIFITDVHTETENDIYRIGGGPWILAQRTAYFSRLLGLSEPSGYEPTAESAEESRRRRR